MIILTLFTILFNCYKIQFNPEHLKRHRWGAYATVGVGIGIAAYTAYCTQEANRIARTQVQAQIENKE